MQEIIVKNQTEMDAVPEDLDGKIVIAAGNEMVTVRRRYRNPIEVRGNSTVMALRNSTVMALENSTVMALGNSMVKALGNSTVEARGNSTVMALGNSAVTAWDNSTVTAGGNAQVLDAERRGNIQTSGNARVVCNPSTIQEWADYNGVEIKDGKIRLYKAVHGIDGKYVSDYDESFVYMVGETAESGGFEDDPETGCGEGIHLSTLPWAARHGRTWDDLALLELEAEASEIVVPLFETGKVRAPRAKVIREVPLEEAGLIGKMIAKRRKK